MFNFLKNIGPLEIGVVILIFVILFGAKAVSGLAKTSGKSFKEIKKIKKTFKDAADFDEDDKSAKKN